MKTKLESIAASAPDHLTEALRPQLNAIIGSAERLKMKSEHDEDIEQILLAARGSLDAVNREANGSHPGKEAVSAAANERCDVLYIEDNPITFASVKLLLTRKRNLRVLHATDGENGMLLAQTHQPKLILLDLDLPDVHGSEVIQRLQKEPTTAHIPVVVISGDATPSQIERLLVLGARNYLTKPFETEPFLAVVDDLMQEHAAKAPSGAACL